MATYSSILAWEIPWIEEPGGLSSMGSQRDMTECLSAHTHTHTIDRKLTPDTWSLAQLVAQLVENLLAMQETLIRFLGWKDLLEKG